MSQSESNGGKRIKFGSTTRSEILPSIRKFPFPDRLTIHWVPPDRVMTDGFSIVITSDVLIKVSHHVAQSLNYEIGGFLLGNRCYCPNTGREYITIDQCVEARFTKHTNVSLTFTHETFGDLDEALTGKYYGKKLLGWYHSHPGLSIFLSENDLVIHRERFVESWMVALVLEPEKHLGGFFSWSNGKIDPNRYVNFYELLNDGARESVIAWKNYEGFDPLKGAPPILSSITTQTSLVPANIRASIPPATGSELTLDHGQILPLNLQRAKLLWLRTVTIVLGVLAVSGVIGFLINDIVNQPQVATTVDTIQPGPSPSSSPPNGTGTPTPTPSPSPTPSETTAATTAPSAPTPTPPRRHLTETPPPSPKSKGNRIAELRARMITNVQEKEKLGRQKQTQEIKLRIASLEAQITADQNELTRLGAHQ